MKVNNIKSEFLNNIKLRKCKKEWECKDELLPDFYKIHKEVLEGLNES